MCFSFDQLCRLYRGLDCMTEKKNKVELLIWPILIALPDEEKKKNDRGFPFCGIR
jgi:hypothetical protein